MDIYHQPEHQILMSYHSIHPVVSGNNGSQQPQVTNVTNYTLQPQQVQQQVQQQAQQQQQMQPQMQLVSYMYHDLNMYPAAVAHFPQWNSKFLTSYYNPQQQQQQQQPLDTPVQIPQPPGAPHYQALVVVEEDMISVNSAGGNAANSGANSSSNSSSTPMVRSSSTSQFPKKPIGGNVSPYSQHHALYTQGSLPQAVAPPQYADDHLQMLQQYSPNSSRSLAYPVFSNGGMPMIDQSLPPLRGGNSAGVGANGFHQPPLPHNLSLPLSMGDLIRHLDFLSGGSSFSMSTSNGLKMGKKREKKRRNTIDGMSIETLARNRCPTCQKQFKRPSSLKTHMYSHTGEKPFVCLWDGCEKIFSVRSNMVRHLKLHEKRNSTSSLPSGSHFQFSHTGSIDASNSSSTGSWTSSNSAPTGASSASSDMNSNSANNIHDHRTSLQHHHQLQTHQHHPHSHHHDPVTDLAT